MPSYADAVVPILKSPSEVAPTNACARGDPGRGTCASRRTVVAQVLTYAAALFRLDPKAFEQDILCVVSWRPGSRLSHAAGARLRKMACHSAKRAAARWGLRHHSAPLWAPDRRSRPTYALNSAANWRQWVR
jgi:hypothetical protein